MIRDLAAEALAAMSPKPGESPQLPTVGRIVHFYNRSWVLEGPYAAIVSRVTLISENDQSIQAKIDLTVFTTDVYHPIVLFKDVPVSGPGDISNLDLWWVWPPRS
jgi:hypothetical protein